MAFVAVACAALAQPSDLWASALFTFTLAGLAGAILAAVFRVGERRPFWIGAAICGWLYLFLVFGPGCEQTIGRRLITTGGLRWLETKWHPLGASSGQAVYAAPMYAPSTYVATPTFVGGGAPATAGNTISIVTTTAAMPYPLNVWGGGAFHPSAPGFQTIGHCALVWPLAFLGGVLAMWLSGTRRRGSGAAASRGDANMPTGVDS